MEDESSDESDTEMTADNPTVTSKGKHDLMMKSEVRESISYASLVSDIPTLFTFSISAFTLTLLPQF